MYHLTKSRPGVALLLALLVLSAILTASLTVGALVVRELKISGTADRGLLAFYAAESGLEQGLYWLRQEHKTPDQLNLDASSAVVLSNGARWWREGYATRPELITSLAKDEVTQLDLFDPSQTFNQQPALDNLVLRYVSPNSGPEWLEVTISAFTPGTYDLTTRRQYYSSLDLSAGRSVSLAGLINYRVTLRALYAMVKNLRVQAYQGSTVYPLPGITTIKVTGQVADNKQALSVTVPQLVPQASVFDYTIFSQSSLCKGYSTCP